MSETATRLPISEPSAIEEKFAELAARWRTETLPLSSSAQITAHPAYQAIIALGPAVIPLLMRELECSPDHWFAALRTLTGANPVPPEHQGRIREMAADWLQHHVTNG